MKKFVIALSAVCAFATSQIAAANTAALKVSTEVSKKLLSTPAGRTAAAKLLNNKIPASALTAEKVAAELSSVTGVAAKNLEANLAAFVQKAAIKGEEQATKEVFFKADGTPKGVSELSFATASQSANQMFADVKNAVATSETQGQACEGGSFANKIASTLPASVQGSFLRAIEAGQRFGIQLRDSGCGVLSEQEAIENFGAALAESAEATDLNSWAAGLKVGFNKVLGTSATETDYRIQRLSGCPVAGQTAEEYGRCDVLNGIEPAVCNL